MGQGPRASMRAYCGGQFLTPPQSRLLAALLDADGGPVGVQALMRAAVGGRWTGGLRMPSSDWPALTTMLWRLRRAGVDCVALDWPPRRPHLATARLATLPPDWALDQVLATLDDLRRASALPTNRRQRTA